jgi:hypothetical protein
VHKPRIQAHDSGFTHLHKSDLFGITSHLAKVTRQASITVIRGLLGKQMELFPDKSVQQCA